MPQDILEKCQHFSIPIKANSVFISHDLDWGNRQVPTEHVQMNFGQIFICGNVNPFLIASAK